MKNIFFTYLLGLSLVFPTIGQSDSDRSQKYHMNLWDNTTDLGHNTITALLQDNVGYIWIGTPSGLIRFDGVKFSKFDMRNTPAIKSDYISTIYQNSDKTIWIGTKGGGVVSLIDGKWYNYSRENGLSDNFINAVTGDWRGRIWVGTDYGLNVIDGDKIKVYGKAEGLFDHIITALSVGIRGEILIGTFRSGLFRMYKESIDHIGYNEGLVNLSVTKLYTDNNGKLWIGTLGGLFYKNLSENIIVPVKDTRHIPITDIQQVAYSEIWFTSMIRGIDCLTDSYRAIKNIPDEYVRCLLRDRDGTIWAGTDAAGLLQFSKSQIDNILLPGNQVITCATQDDNGNIWIGTRNSGLFQLKDGKTIDKFDQSSGLISDRISTLYIDHNSVLWIGTHDAGVIMKYQNNISQVLPDMDITSILAGDSGSVWIGTTSGLYFTDKDTIKQILGNIPVHSLLKTKINDILITTPNGLYKYSDDTLRQTGLNLSNRLPDILSVCEDRDGRLLLGTNGSGIIILDGEISKSITTLEGLPDNHIVRIFLDDLENVWCATYNGVFMLNKDNVDKFLTDSLKYIIPTWFTDADGMISSQCLPSQGFFNEGKLNIPTAKGIAVIDICNAQSLKPKSLAVYIENVQTDQGHLSFADNTIILPTASEILEIELTAFDYSAKSKLHFRYKLDNHDFEFHYISPVNDRLISYTNLIPGEYILKVQATSHNANWDTKFAEYGITIPYPVYKNLYFQLIFFPVIVAIALSIVYLRHKKNRKKILDKYKTVPITPEKTELITQDLDIVLLDENLYLDPDLTLKALAGKLRIHPNHLSRIINEKYKLSYNDFINKYRIAHARQLLSDPQNSDKTILQMMYTCGFYSKSVFNTAFKKFTGQTPSEFRKLQKD